MNISEVSVEEEKNSTESNINGRRDSAETLEVSAQDVMAMDSEGVGAVKAACSDLEICVTSFCN